MGWMPFCDQTSSVKALKDTQSTENCALASSFLHLLLDSWGKGVGTFMLAFSLAIVCEWFWIFFSA